MILTKYIRSGSLGGRGDVWMEMKFECPISPSVGMVIQNDKVSMVEQIQKVYFDIEKNKVDCYVMDDDTMFLLESKKRKKAFSNLIRQYTSQGWEAKS